MESMKGKVALITGSSSGIGQATAIKFASHHCDVVVTGRNAERLEETTQKCREFGVEVLAIVADLTVEDDVVKLIEQTMNKFGKLNILVNNAGIVELGSLETCRLEQFDKVMNTNIRAVFHLTKLAAPHLVATKGVIVNDSSMLSMKPAVNLLPYVVSKAAIDQFTRCVALELAPKQVRVNSVNPGAVVTKLLRGLDEEKVTAFYEVQKTCHALGRNAEAEEVANSIYFLASDAASFITGTNLLVDGGRNCISPI